MTLSNVSIKQGYYKNLQKLANFLNNNWDYDTIDELLLGEKLFDDPFTDPELCFIAFKKDEIVGFIFCVMRTIRQQKIGYIKLMAVDKHHRRQKIATSLYQKAEKIMIKKGAECIRIYDAPFNYFMPGIDPRYTEAYCFAIKQGFKQFGEAVNMKVDLSSRNWLSNIEEEENKLKEKNIIIRRAKPDNYDNVALKELLSKEWELWNYEVTLAMRDTPPSVHLAFLKGKLRAFSVHNGNNKNTGWFGPMGTHPDLRGMGIGNLLLKRCLEDMKKQGHKYAIIPWVAPIAFYSHFVGAKIERVFWRMEKRLTGD